MIPLKEMTQQQVFDIAASHLLKQNKKSLLSPSHPKYNALSPYPLCAYRSEDGCKCGAGPFIPDSIYNPDMECEQWINLFYKYEDLQSQHAMFIQKIQVIHDNYKVEEWKEKLTNLAKDYGLCIDAVTYSE